MFLNSSEPQVELSIPEPDVPEHLTISLFNVTQSELTETEDELMPFKLFWPNSDDSN
jgi:hypothetical protein